MIIMIWRLGMQLQPHMKLWLGGPRPAALQRNHNDCNNKQLQLRNLETTKHLQLRNVQQHANGEANEIFY